MAMNYTERSPLDLAQDDLQRLDETIAQLQEERTKVMGFIEMYGKYAKPAPMSSAEPTMARSGMVPVDRLPLNIRIGNFVDRWLAGAGEPVAMSNIFEALQKAELVPGGKEPKQAVSAILGKDKRFQYQQGQGWSRVLRASHTPRETL